MNGIPLVDLSIQQRQVSDEVRAGFERLMESGAFVQGPEVAGFERSFAAYCSAAHCVGVANGTDALELALRAVGVGRGDEVILPANTFVATAGAVKRIGATPVLVDCDPEFMLIDATGVSSSVTGRTRALLPVHLYGQIAPMHALGLIAERSGLLLLEDAAQAQGAEQNGRRAGGIGVAAGTSFYPGKNLGAFGDAGAVMTNDAGIAKSVRRLGNHGSDVKYHHPELGFNSRLDTFQAVVLNAKLRRLDGWNDQRRVAANRYRELLNGVDGLTVPATAPGNLHVWHLYVVRVAERDRVVATMNEAGIGASIHYPVPVHLHGAYRDLGYGPGDFPVAEAVAGEILSLPIYPGITEQQQQRVVDALVSALAG